MKFVKFYRRRFRKKLAPLIPGFESLAVVKGNGFLGPTDALKGTLKLANAFFEEGNGDRRKLVGFQAAKIREKPGTANGVDVAAASITQLLNLFERQSDSRETRRRL